MTTDNRAQVLRIAHLLGVADKELDFLEGIDSGSLRELHSQIAEVLFDSNGSNLSSLQAAAKILPPAVTAKVAEKALGPVLCGHIAGSVDPSLAVSIAKRLPSKFLADVAGHVHPNQIGAILSKLPTSQVNQAAEILVERGDVIALGHFSSIVSDETLDTVIARLSDSALLDVAPFIEPVERTGHVIGLVPEERLVDVIRAAHDHGRWVDAFDLVDRLPTSQRTRIAAAVVPEPDLIEGALKAAVELDRWSELLAFASHADKVPAEVWLSIEGFKDKKLVASAIASVERHDLWDELTRLVDLWPDELRKTFAKNVKAKYRARIGL